jgi:hypothetical protein
LRCGRSAGSSPLPVAVGGIEIHLQDRPQPQLGGGLHDSVPNRRDTERPFAAAGLWDRHPPHRFRPTAIAAFSMDGMQSNEAGSSMVSITVLLVTPMRAGRLFALASVEIDIDGVRIEVRGIRNRRRQ